MSINVFDDVFYGLSPPPAPALPPAPTPPPLPPAPEAPTDYPAVPPPPLVGPGQIIAEIDTGVYVVPSQTTPAVVPVAPPPPEASSGIPEERIRIPSGMAYVDVGDGTFIPAPSKTPSEPAPPPPSAPSGGEVIEVELPPDEPSETHYEQSAETIVYELLDIDGFETLGNIVLRGQRFVDYTRNRAEALGLDPYAVFAEAYHEGIGGGIGDSGHSYGPWQLYTGGRLPKQFASRVNDERVNAWAWSQEGIDYALRGMAGTKAKGLRGLMAVYYLTRDYEHPANWEARNLERQRTYEQLSRLGGGAWTFLAGLAKGPRAVPAETTQPPEAQKTQPSGLMQNWRGLLAVFRDDLPATGTHMQNTARRLGKAVS